MCSFLDLGRLLRLLNDRENATRGAAEIFRRIHLTHHKRKVLICSGNEHAQIMVIDIFTGWKLVHIHKETIIMGLDGRGIYRTEYHVPVAIHIITQDPVCFPVRSDRPSAEGKDRGKTLLKL